MAAKRSSKRRSRRSAPLRVTQFLQQLLNGLSLGSIYALIALGYTMVYGVLKLDQLRPRRSVHGRRLRRALRRRVVRHRRIRGARSSFPLYLRVPDAVRRHGRGGAARRRDRAVSRTAPCARAPAPDAADHGHRREPVPAEPGACWCSAPNPRRYPPIVARGPLRVRRRDPDQHQGRDLRAWRWRSMLGLHSAGAAHAGPARRCARCRSTSMRPS